MIDCGEDFVGHSVWIKDVASLHLIMRWKRSASWTSCHAICSSFVSAQTIGPIFGELFSRLLGRNARDGATISSGSDIASASVVNVRGAIQWKRTKLWPGESISFGAAERTSTS